jgi:hypothetical protein
MIARFESDDQRSSPGSLARRSERHGFGVHEPNPAMGAFSRYGPIGRQHHSPDPGIRVGPLL